ncbi:MAG TPA: general secretion pathway protein GspI [Methylococcaceae bacterium]|nr:general secretion pathway protein GspI [Methylococcaceae bacterium]
MIDFDAPIEAQLQKFWRWWLSEIIQIVPDRALKLLSRRQELLVLSLEEDCWVIHRIQGSLETEIQRIALNDLGPGHFAEFIAEYPELAETKIALRLMKGQGLRRQFKLPMAAEENLAQVIGLEMDRLTPFTQDQVTFATRILSRTKATRQILVELIIAPRDFLESTLDSLSRAGWLPVNVHLETETKINEYNLIPERFKPQGDKLVEMLNIGLSSAILAIVILILVLPVWMTRIEVTKVQSELKKTTKAAQEVESMREQAEKLLHQAQFLQEKKRTEPILVDAMDELTRVIPDDTWLNGLQYANHRVVIQGQSPSASVLLKQIEGSRHFKDVSFVSPVTKDAGNNLERFQIAFDVVNGRFSEEAH